jgi:hypothetical protein
MAPTRKSKSKSKSNKRNTVYVVAVCILLAFHFLTQTTELSPIVAPATAKNMTDGAIVMPEPSQGNAIATATAASTQTETTNRAPHNKSNTTDPLLATKPATQSTSAPISTPTSAPATPEVAKAEKCVRKWTDKFTKTQQQQNSTRRPILYIHPGPPKTATSTIQSLLEKYSKNLTESNIFYIGKYNPLTRSYFKCDFPLPSWCIAYARHRPNNECEQIMTKQLDTYFEAGVDVIYSEEVLGAQFAYPKHRGAETSRRYTSQLPRFMNEVVRKNNWDVRILIGYRPYFDFLRSEYNQLHKYSEAKANLVKWPAEKKGKAIPLLRDSLAQQSFFPPPGDLFDAFREYADNVAIFDIAPNVHDGKDLTVHFFCDLLEGADSACAAQTAAVEARGGAIHSNTAEELHFDRIATTAADLGLVSIKNNTRRKVSEKIHEYLDLSGTKVSDLPLLCPSKNLIDKLYNRSMAEEMKLFPDRDPDWMVPAIFNESLSKKKLCSVDTEKLLEDPEWQQFLRSI